MSGAKESEDICYLKRVQHLASCLVQSKHSIGGGYLVLQTNRAGIIGAPYEEQVEKDRRRERGKNGVICWSQELHVNSRPVSLFRGGNGQGSIKEKDI